MVWALLASPLNLTSKIYPMYHDEGVSGHAVRVNMRFRSKLRGCVPISLVTR